MSPYSICAVKFPDFLTPTVLLHKGVIKVVAPPLVLFWVEWNLWAADGRWIFVLIIAFL